MASQLTGDLHGQNLLTYRTHLSCTVSGQNIIVMHRKKGTNHMESHIFNGTGWQFKNEGGVTKGSHSTVCSWGPGRVDAFCVGTNGQAYWKWADGGSNNMSGWQTIGGECHSSIECCAARPGRIDLVVIGPNNTPYHQFYNRGGNWSGWQAVPGMQAKTVRLISRGGRAELAVIGMDDSCYYKVHDGQQWGPNVAVGGKLLGNVDACSWEPNRVDLFGIGTNQQAYHNTFQNGQWGGWKNIEGKFLSRVSVCLLGPGQFVVLGVGLNKCLYQRLYNNGWTGTWTSIGGQSQSDVSCCSLMPGRADVFVEGTDGAVWHKYFQGGNWSANWEKMGAGCNVAMRN